MLYNEINTANIEGINNYIVEIKPMMEASAISAVSGTTTTTRWGKNTVMRGVMNDKEISLPFGIQLTNPGSIEGVNAVASAVNDFLDFRYGSGKAERAGKAKNADAVNKAKKFQGNKDLITGAGKKAVGLFQKFTGLDLKDMQPQYSVVRPDGYAKPSISFKCTFYKGVNIKGYIVKDFKSFAKQLAGATFPDEIGAFVASFLVSPQLTISDYIALSTIGFGGAGIRGDSGGKQFGFSVKVGNLLQVDSLWLKDAKISAPTIFDSAGQPLVWDVDFEFEYYRQPTYNDICKWLMVNN